jgi:hypothetical protein
MKRTLFDYIKAPFAYRKIDPQKDEERIDKYYHMGEMWALMVVAFVSSGGAALFGWTTAGSYVDWLWLKILAALFCFVASAVVTDLVLKDLIQKMVFDLMVGAKIVFGRAFSKTARTAPFNFFMRLNQFLEWKVIAVLCIGIYIFDYYQVQIIKTPAAQMVKKEKTLNADSLRKDFAAQESARVGAVTAAITAAEIDIRATQKAIEQERRRIASGYDKGIELYEKRNAWFFKKKLNPAFSKSSRLKDLNAQLQDLESNRLALTKQRTKDLEYSSTAIAQKDATLTETNQKIQASNEARSNGVAFIMVMFGFILKVIAGAFRIIRVFRYLGRNAVDANGDGTIDYRDVDAAAKMGFQGA